MTFIVTYGISLIVENLVLYFWGADYRSAIPAYAGAGFSIGTLIIPYVRIGVLIISMVLVFSLFYFLENTRIGLGIRATRMNRDAAKLMGANIGKIYAITFAIGMGLLFIVIGTFTGALSALPGSGSWMETVKHAFGAILIGGAIFFLKPILPSGIYYLLWGILLIAVGVFNGALEFSVEGRKWGKTFGMICLVSGLILFINGFARSFDFVQSKGSTTVVEENRKGIDWIVNDTDKAFAEAKSSGKRILLDFYADWCAACRELEEKTWVAQEFVNLSSDWIYLKLDLTRMTPDLKVLQEFYQVRGMPTVIFFNSEGVETGRFSGFKTAQDVLNLMSSQ